MQNSIMRSLHLRAIRAVAIFLIGLLAACSLVRFGYNHGESLTYWWLNGYADFESEQEPQVRREIDQLFAWHRKTQLKDYIQLFGRAQSQLIQPVTPAETLALYDELKKRAWIVVEQALPALADLALSLSPQQIAHIERKFASNNDDYRKDYLHRDLDHRQKHRYKKIMQQAEYWFGDFNREQEALIRQASDARPLNNELWMEERLRRQRDMIAMLKKIQTEKPSKEVTMSMLRKYAQSALERSDRPEQQAFFDNSRNATAQLAALIINTATPTQKARAMKNMQNWMDNFSVLAAQAN